VNFSLENSSSVLQTRTTTNGTNGTNAMLIIKWGFFQSQKSRKKQAHLKNNKLNVSTIALIIKRQKSNRK
jgi:hypothetical protein